MRQLLLVAAVSGLVMLASADTASARGRRGGCGGGGCGGGGCGSYSGGGCYGGGCYSGGYTGGYYGGCAGGVCGVGGAVSSCPGGVCAVAGAPAVGTYAGLVDLLQEKPATLVVSLPQDAKLTIDGTPTSLTSAQRVFETPALERGKDFHYTLKAEVTREGKVDVVSRRVTVRAGETTAVQLDVPARGVAAR